MRIVCWFLALSLAAVACGDGRPDTAEWTNEVWNPLVSAVPAPPASDPGSCESALAELRDMSEVLKPAPDAEIGSAADKWLRRAETLMFKCAAAEKDFDYKTGHEDLTRLADEVATLLGSADR